jgi:hypothetical protein
VSAPFKVPRLTLPIDQALSVREKHPATKCSAPGCNRATNERKPYCARHVTCLPYAAEVAARVKPEKPRRKWDLECRDCKAPFRAYSRQARYCVECKRLRTNKRCAEVKAKRKQQREAS